MLIFPDIKPIPGTSSFIIKHKDTNTLDLLYPISCSGAAKYFTDLRPKFIPGFFCPVALYFRTPEYAASEGLLGRRYILARLAATNPESVLAAYHMLDKAIKKQEELLSRGAETEPKFSINKLSGASTVQARQIPLEDGSTIIEILGRGGKSLATFQVSIKEST